MPEWLNVLAGFAKDLPGYAILLVIGWLFFRHLANQQKDHLQSLKDDKQAEINRLITMFDKTMEAKDNEIDRLLAEKESLQKDRDSLYKMLKAEKRTEEKK